MPTVMVELPGGEGVVRLDDGEIVLTHDVSDHRGQRLRREDRYEPAKAWLDDDRSMVGGLLPPGAVSAEVIDDRGERVAATIGGGAYVAILDQRIDGQEAVVCCRDGAGAPVRRPLADDYPCAPVHDAEEPCPACGALDYEERTPTESWRGGRPGPGGTTIPSPIVVCRICGHQEREGSIMRFHGPDDEDDAARQERIARARRAQRVQRWYSNKLTLRAVTFPIYAAEGWAARIGGSGSSGDDLTELSIAHGETEDADPFEALPRIVVSTSTEGPWAGELAVAHNKLEQWIQDDIDPPGATDRSDAAITLSFHALRRRRRAAALAAIRSDADITIDGATASFVTLTTPSGRWVAVRRHEDLTVTIAARDLDPSAISLEPIADPAARLLGPEPEDV